MAKTRIKQDAVNYRAPQDRDECDGHINRIGILDGEIKSLQAEMNAEIAKVTETFIGKFSPKQDEMKLLQQGVKLFCEANRMDLTQKGRVKTVNFLSGVVQWRQRPPSVSVSGPESVVKWLEETGLARFVRTKKEVNKEAILNEPEAVLSVPGIKIKTGAEDFIIEPAQVIAEAA